MNVIKQTIGLCTFALETVRNFFLYHFLRILRSFRYRTLILYSMTPFDFKYFILVLMNLEFWPNRFYIFAKHFLQFRSTVLLI